MCDEIHKSEFDARATAVKPVDPDLVPVKGRRKKSETGVAAAAAAGNAKEREVR